MHTNSLTYEFPNTVKGDDMAPEAMVLTLTTGESIRYIPEAKAGEVFRPGQIVRVRSTSSFQWNCYGVVQAVEEEVNVAFGNDSVWFYPYSLEIIHEAE